MGPTLLTILKAFFKNICDCPNQWCVLTSRMNSGVYRMLLVSAHVRDSCINSAIHAASSNTTITPHPPVIPN